MNDGAWRFTRHLIFSPMGALISLPDGAWADTAEHVNNWPVFQEYAQAKAIEGGKRAGIWDINRFVHPYGARYCGNPTMQ